jgi:hypothetical protein
VPILTSAEGPLVSSLALKFLQDTTVSIEIDPISHNCQSARSSCSSYLIPGGLQNITPWPYFQVNDSSLAFYITKNALSYQVDFWDVPTSFNWSNHVSCNIYGFDDHSAFQLCMSSGNRSKNEIAAGKGLLLISLRRTLLTIYH